MPYIVFIMKKIPYNRVIRKVRKTQRQYPGFGRTQGEIKKNLQKEHQHARGDETEKTINFGGKPVFDPVCPFSRAPATYIFTAPNCTTTTISLEPCALNAEC